MIMITAMADTQVVYRYLNNNLASNFDVKMENLLSKTIVNRCFGGEVSAISSQMEILMTDAETTIIDIPENSKTSFDTRIMVSFEFRDFNAETEEEAFYTVDVLIEKSSNPNFKDLMRIDISSASGLCH
jgi:small nuclear ribonucleoprotein (snRNP)-like protein